MLKRLKRVLSIRVCRSAGVAIRELSTSRPCSCRGQPSYQSHPHLLKPGEVCPGLTQEEFATRRWRMMQAVSVEASNSLLLVPSAPTRYMSNNIPYPYHQDTDFLYLCGFQQPGGVLVLHSEPTRTRKHVAALFVPRRDPARELWDGPRTGPDGAAELTGIDVAFPVDELPGYLSRFRDPAWTLWCNDLDLGHPGWLRRCLDVVMGEARRGARLQSPNNYLHLLRLVKSPAEQHLMEMAGEITAQALIDTMATCKAPVDEAYLYAKFEFECRVRGAEILAYPPVIAGGNRANTLHYIKNNQIIKNGALVLVDGGCEYRSYASDVTRTWPVNGRFSAAQVAVYEAVLRVQRACVAQCRPGTTLHYLQQLMLSLLEDELQELRIVDTQLDSLQKRKATQRYCPHHVGHFLGLDVHDSPSVPHNLPLQPAMVLTIEPGLYIPEEDHEAPDAFRGIGVRIEDDVLITDTGARVLSARCPTDPQDIESICGSR
uniref:xaa-Pro aminopeptidase 3 n=1 Tax=Myxine glutinosa TaxID=7769 RepID=UPI00358DFF0E